MTKEETAGLISNEDQLALREWHIGAMNDACFIIDQKPRPAPVDHLNPNALPNVNVISKAIDAGVAEQIVDAHNVCVRMLGDLIERQQAEIARLRTDWQPIETAPKDGTEFLGWDAERAQVKVTSWTQWGGGYWHVPSWGSMGVYYPTHWMPLPPSPNQCGDER